MDFGTILVSFLVPFGIHFRHFFGIDFWMPFWESFFDFSGKIDPKMITQTDYGLRLAAPPGCPQDASGTPLGRHLEFSSTLYAPRMPADPFARSVSTRS